MIIAIPAWSFQFRSTLQKFPKALSWSSWAPDHPAVTVNEAKASASLLVTQNQSGNNTNMSEWRKHLCHWSTCQALFGSASMHVHSLALYDKIWTRNMFLVWRLQIALQKNEHEQTRRKWHCTALYSVKDQEKDLRWTSLAFVAWERWKMNLRKHV